MDDNFNDRKCSKHHMEDGSSESKFFLQKKIALTEAADIILETSRKVTKSVAVEALEFLKTSDLQSSDCSEGSSSLEVCSKVS